MTLHPETETGLADQPEVDLDEAVLERKRSAHFSQDADEDGVPEGEPED